MRTTTWWRRCLRLFGVPAGREAARRRGRSGRPGHRPHLETLEARWAPAASTVQFALANESLVESAGAFTIPVILSAASNSPVSVPFTLGGNAVAGTDFNGVTASPVVIPAGQTAVNITGTLLDDGAPDAVKTLTLTLGTPTGATLGAPAVNTLTIAEPPANPTTLSIANSSAVEPGPGGTVNMVFTVTRSGDLTSQITVGFTTVAGTARPATDFTPTTGTTTFASGSATATISVPIFGNGVFNNPSLTFSVQLTGVVSEFGPPVTFADQGTFAAGTSPLSVAVGDVNGDGKPDLVVAEFLSNNVSVLLNTTAPGATTPSFAAQKTFGLVGRPNSVTVADVNGDGRPDIIIADTGGNAVAVLLNTMAPGATTPTFAAQQEFTTGFAPRSLAVGDVNGDGRPDLLLANYSSNTVSVLLNTTAPGATTASFATQQTFATGNGPQSVAVADVNGDGQPDLIVGDSSDATASVLLNTTAPGATTASFATQQTFAAGPLPLGVVVGDVNGDGRPDLVFANGGGATVLLNLTAPGASTASFATQQTFATGNDCRSVAMADVNGDGRPDLVLANGGSATVSVLRNMTAPGASTASFATQQTFATGNGPMSVALGDVNGDGKPDLVTANYFSNTVSVLLNTTVLGAATITPDFPQRATPAVGSGPVSVAVGDLNGDGKPDLVVANRDGATASVLLNTTAPGATAPSFATQQTFATGTGPQSVAVADLNGDGRPDLVVANYAGGVSTLSVLLNTAAAGATTPSFATQQTFATGAHPDSVAVADVNGDGRPDLVVANYGAATVSVLLNTAAPGATTPSFATQQTFAAGSVPFSVAVADVNGDGRPDLVVANYGAATVSVLLNTAAPGATTASFATQQTFPTGTGPFAVTVADVNGDGRPDLVVANYGAATVSVLLNTTAPGATTPSFASPQTFAAGIGPRGPRSVAVGDVNGDGKPDLVVADMNDNTALVLRNTTAPGATAASFATQQTFATGNEPTSVAVGDVNGDGRPDLLLANNGTGTVSVLVNTPVTILGNLATGTITESDTQGTPTVQFSVAGESVDEAGDFSITVTLSAASASSVSVPFTLGGTAVAGTDYSGVTASPLVIAAGSTSGTITGTLLDDGAPDAVKTLTFTLGTPTGATLGTPATNTLTITEPAATPTVQFSTAGESVSETAGAFSVTVTLSAASASSVSVPFTLGGTAVAGTDFSGVTASPLVIPAGSTSGTITGTLLDDGAPDAVKTLTFTLGTPTGASLGTPATNTLTITEPGATPTVQFGAAAESVDESAGTFSITVTLSAASDASVSVPFTLGGSAVAGTDSSGVTASPLVIPAGQTTGTITGTVIDDGLYGGSINETLTFTLGTPTGATLGSPSINTLTAKEITARPSFPGLTPQERYVQALYVDELGRTGQMSELDSWVAVLNGPGGAAVVIAGIKGSPEGTDHLVKSWYQLFLGRPASRDEELGWASALRQGQTEETVLSGILAEPVHHEFYDRAQTLASGSTADQRYVQALYQVLLHRTGTDSEVAAWVTGLSWLGRQGVAQGFLTSIEFRTDLFEHYYNSLLHRHSEEPGLHGWVFSTLDASTVRADFEITPEFFGNG